MKLEDNSEMIALNALLGISQNRVQHVRLIFKGLEINDDLHSINYAGTLILYVMFKELAIVQIASVLSL